VVLSIFAIFAKPVAWSGFWCRFGYSIPARNYILQKEITPGNAYEIGKSIASDRRASDSSMLETQIRVWGEGGRGRRRWRWRRGCRRAGQRISAGNGDSTLCQVRVRVLVVFWPVPIEEAVALPQPQARAGGAGGGRAVR
jgi:hypothetical protein